MPADIPQNYAGDSHLGPLWRALGGELPEEPVQRACIERLLPSYFLKDHLMYYDGKLCVLWDNISDILQLAHDNRTAGHFAASKHFARLEGFHWRYKTCNV